MFNEPHLKMRHVVEVWKVKYAIESNKNIKISKNMQNGDKNV